jgi:hypothetical protein
VARAPAHPLCAADESVRVDTDAVDGLHGNTRKRDKVVAKILVIQRLKCATVRVCGNDSNRSELYSRADEEQSGSEQRLAPFSPEPFVLSSAR